MRGVLDSDLELVIESGFIYAPLLFDPSVENELRTRKRPNTLREVNGQLFVKTVSLQSLIENYATFDTDAFEDFKQACARKHGQAAALCSPSLDEKLRIILFQVLPHFVRRERKRGRRALSEADVLDLIGEKVGVPATYSEDSVDFLNAEPVGGMLDDQPKPWTPVEPPGEGMISAGRLREWVQKALEARILEGETRRFEQVLKERDQLRELRGKHVAILSDITREGALEIDGFGFSKMGRGDEYVVYKHTGEYALKDYYGRIYLFPDCRVAVSTVLPLKPFVMETYKHPFLEGHDSGQPVCLRAFSPARALTGAAVINALEEGINALLYGYSSRRRNGYHSLEGMRWHLGTLDGTLDPDDFETPPYGDYPVIRSRYLGPISFEDYRVSRDHPQIALRQVAITNDATP